VSAVEAARPWFLQAKSDLRTAEALHSAPKPLTTDDVGCHAVAMCSQAIEKGIKGYVLVNGATPSMDHRPDKYLISLLTKDDPLLRYKDHHRHLSKLFTPATRQVVGQLLDSTPGGLGHRDDVPNTEYPWKVAGDWRHTPYAASAFANQATLKEWFDITRRVLDILDKLRIAAEKGDKL
jgi:hypothetical protein